MFTLSVYRVRRRLRQNAVQRQALRINKDIFLVFFFFHFLYITHQHLFIPAVATVIHGFTAPSNIMSINGGNMGDEAAD